MRMGRRNRNLALSITAIFAVMCTAESCDEKDIKKEFRKWNIKAGKATVASNEAWDEIYEEVANEHTQDIVDEHGDDPDWTEEMAVAEFEKRMAEINKHNDRFEDSMVIIANSLEAIEQSLDAADHIDAELWRASIRDILNALENVTNILNEFAMDAENEKFNSALNWIGVAINGANQLMDALGAGSKPTDDPKDD